MNFGHKPPTIGDATKTERHGGDTCIAHMVDTSEVPSKVKKCGTNGACRIFKPVVVCTHTTYALGSLVRVGKQRFHLEKTLLAPTLHRAREKTIL